MMDHFEPILKSSILSGEFHFFFERLLNVESL